MAQLRATPAAVVVGGTLEALGGTPPPPPAFYLSQADALGAALPRQFVPAGLVAAEALHEAAEWQRLAAAGPSAAAPLSVAGPGGAPAAAGEGGAGAADCLAACCLHDDLHLFSPAGPTRSLVSWARLPLPLLLEGSQFCYPLRQCPLPAPALQLALSLRAGDGWDSTLWHPNLPILAARSAYSLSLLQLAEAAPGDAEAEQQRQHVQPRGRRAGNRGGDWRAARGGEGEEGGGLDEWEEDDGGGFELRRLCAVGAARPTAHACWQRHQAQQPLLLLQDGTLLEAKLGQGVQVVQAWQAPPDALPPRLQGVLQVQGGAMPRTALLALRDRLCQLDLRSGGAGGATLRPLWQCPPGQHLTALCAPPPAAAAAPGPACTAAAPDHLVAAASAGGRGSGTRVLVFDVRRPGQPVASWEQPPFDQHSHEALTLLRWLPLAAGSGGPAGGAGGAAQREGSRWGGLLLGASSAAGRVLACQLSVTASGPELQAKEGKITEKPAGSAALLLERLQAALEQQEEARQARQTQQAKQPAAQQGDAPAGAAAAARVGLAPEQRGQELANGAAPMDVDAGEQQAAASPAQQAAQQQGGEQLLPPPLRAPPPLPLPPQLLWRPMDRSTHVTAAPGPPLLLCPPLEQQPALAERLAAGRLQLQKQQAAAGGGIRVTKVPLPGPQRAQQALLGLAAVATDWETQQPLPLPVLASLTPHGDITLSLLQGQQPAAQQAQQQQQQQQHAALALSVLPLLLPASEAAAGSGSDREEEGAAGLAAGPGPGAALLPHVRGVPRALVAAVAAGDLGRCGCCAKCLAASPTCLTVRALEQAGVLASSGTGARRSQAQRLLTVPAGEQKRSVVQLPLHAALAQQLLLEHARSADAGQGGAAPAPQAAPQALRAVLRRLRRSCTSLQELHAAAQLQQQVDAFESDSSSEERRGSSSGSGSTNSATSSSDGGGSSGEEAGPDEEGNVAAAARQLRREHRRLRRRLERDALRQRRQERRLQHQQRQQQLAAILAGSYVDAAGTAAQQRSGRGGKGSARGTGQRKRKGAAAVVQQQEPGSPALEMLLQQAGLLPLRRPRGRAAEAAAAPFGPAEQGRRLREPSAPPLPGAALQGHVEEAMRSQDGADSAAAAAQAGAAGREQPARAEWQLHARSFVLHCSRAQQQAAQQQAAQQQAAAGGALGPSSGAHQSQQPQQQGEAAQPLRVQAAGAAAAVLLLVERPAAAGAEKGAATSAAAAAATAAGSAAARPLLRLRRPQQVGAEASAALQQLRAAWG